MRFTWTVILDEQAYTIDLDHGIHSGKRLIYVNDKLVHKASKFWDMGTSRHPFPIGTHDGEITVLVRFRGTVIYELYVDGVVQETQTKSYVLLKSGEYWGFLCALYFVALGIGILFLFRNYAGTILNWQALLNVIITIVFAYTGWRVARNSSLSVLYRIIACITFIGLYFIIMIILSSTFFPAACNRVTCF